MLEVQRAPPLGGVGGDDLILGREDAAVGGLDFRDGHREGDGLGGFALPCCGHLLLVLFLRVSLAASSVVEGLDLALIPVEVALGAGERAGAEVWCPDLLL